MIDCVEFIIIKSIYRNFNFCLTLNFSVAARKITLCIICLTKNIVVSLRKMSVSNVLPVIQSSRFWVSMPSNCFPITFTSCDSFWSSFYFNMVFNRVDNEMLSSLSWSKASWMHNNGFHSFSWNINTILTRLTFFNIVGMWLSGAMLITFKISLLPWSIVQL